MTFDRSIYIEEPSIIERELKIIFKRKLPSIIFDIGACEGEDSVKYSRLFPKSKIFSFEPLPDNIELIKQNVSKYGIENVSLHNLALSSENGTADFFVSDGRPENAIESDWNYGNKSSSLLAPKNHTVLASFINFEKRINVETVTLKSFCSKNNLNQIDFVHLDVQGAELMVLEGAADFISSIKLIWLEVSRLDIYQGQPLANDISRFMKQNNFILFKNSLTGIQGDQLYISKSFFSSHTILFFKCRVFIGSILKRIAAKIEINK